MISTWTSHRPLPIAGLATLICTLALLVVALAPGAEAEAAKKIEKGPRGEAFYQPPSKLPKGHGKVIWQRRSSGLVPLDNARWNKNVLYTSKSPQRQRIAVSGSVSIPEGKPPRGGWPVVTWAHGTTGVADECAPSKNREGDPVMPYISYVNPQLSEFLDDGYAVVRTDYQGLGTPGPHPYLIGKSEARSTLDIVRAAQQLSPAIGDRVMIAGHSQGGQSALFAARYAPSWTPELKLKGTIAYAPASHTLEQAKAIEALTAPSGLTALASMIIYGTATANPGVHVEQLLSDEVLALYPDLDSQCLPQLGLPSSLGGIPPSELLREGADTKTAFEVLGRNNPAIETDAPILLAQGEDDATVFPFFTDALDKELDGLGDAVDYRTYPGVDHAGIVAAAQPQALQFLAERMPTR